MSSNNRKSFIVEISSFYWILIMVLMIAATANSGCKHDDSTQMVQVSSVSRMAVFSSEKSNNFGACAVNAVYDVPMVRPSALIVSGEDDLVIDCRGDCEIWRVVPGKTTEFETLIRSYYTSASWEPDLCPSTNTAANDLRVMLSAFMCADGINMGDLAPRTCPTEYVPSSLFQYVGNNTAIWDYSGFEETAITIRFVILY